MIKNLKIRVKLMVAFAIVVTLCTAMMIYTMSKMEKVGKLTDQLYQSPFTVSTQSSMIQAQLQRMGRGMAPVWKESFWRLRQARLRLRTAKKIPGVRSWDGLQYLLRTRHGRLAFCWSAWQRM